MTIIIWNMFYKFTCLKLLLEISARYIACETENTSIKMTIDLRVYEDKK